MIGFLVMVLWEAPRALYTSRFPINRRRELYGLPARVVGGVLTLIPATYSVGYTTYLVVGEFPGWLGALFALLFFGGLPLMVVLCSAYGEPVREAVQVASPPEDTPATYASPIAELTRTDAGLPASDDDDNVLLDLFEPVRLFWVAPAAVVTGRLYVRRMILLYGMPARVAGLALVPIPWVAAAVLIGYARLGDWPEWAPLAFGVAACGLMFAMLLGQWYAGRPRFTGELGSDRGPATRREGPS